MNSIQTRICGEGYGWNYMKYMNMGLTWPKDLPSLKSTLIKALSIINLLSFVLFLEKKLHVLNPKPYTLPSFLIHPSIHPFIYPCMHLSIHPSMHAFIHSSIHSSIHACIYPFIHSSIYPCMHLSIHPFIHPSMHAFIHSSIHSSIHACIYPFIHSSIYPCMHLSIHPFINYNNSKGQGNFTTIGIYY
jgi:hypothetical protein